MNLSSPYPFKQPPNPAAVAALVADRDGSLGDAIKAERSRLSVLRTSIRTGGGKSLDLRAIARASERLRQLEAALREVVAAAQECGPRGGGEYSRARCPRCHRDAQAFSAFGRMGRLVLFHDAGGMFCSGTGEQVQR